MIPAQALSAGPLMHPSSEKSAWSGQGRLWAQGTGWSGSKHRLVFLWRWSSELKASMEKLKIWRCWGVGMSCSCVTAHQGHGLCRQQVVEVQLSGGVPAHVPALFPVWTPLWLRRLQAVV